MQASLQVQGSGILTVFQGREFASVPVTHITPSAIEKARELAEKRLILEALQTDPE